MNTQPQTQFKVLLLGDAGIDTYQYGIVTKLSPEAPVPIIKYAHSETKPGMAANVEANLKALGMEVDFISGARTCIKSRIIDIKSKQHLLRIDNDAVSKPITVDTCGLYHAIVISDYEKGSITYELVEGLRKRYNGPIFIDTKKTDLARFDGCIVKINETEYNNAKTYTDEIICTRGDRPVLYKDQQIVVPNVQAYDVCGAGDTFLAALCYKYLLTENMIESIHFANKAAAITVKHIGVYAPSLEEIENASNW